MSASNRTVALNFVKNSDMIQELLIDIEMDVKYKIYTEQKNLIAVKNLKELLSQIDHEVEVVPYEDKEKLSRLLVSLKGQALNDNEYRMIERIIKNKNWKRKSVRFEIIGNRHSWKSKCRWHKSIPNKGLLRKKFKCHQTMLKEMMRMWCYQRSLLKRPFFIPKRWGF